MKEIIERKDINLDDLKEEYRSRLIEAESSYFHYAKCTNDRVRAAYALKDKKFYQSVLYLILSELIREEER